LAKDKERTFFFTSQEQVNPEAAEAQNKNISPLSGLACDSFNRRPLAVMLSADTVTRPLSGLSEADMVFEMQVVQNSITRFMAVYVCNSPIEIGSIRSARHPFIALAMGIDAIYAHWGGSHFALDKLDAKIMDNIDALKNPFDAFFRKATIYAPHNGFSSMERLVNSASKLGYSLENKFEGYPHLENPKSKILNPKNTIIKIGYAYPWNVGWDYDAQNNSYLRMRGNKPEMDKNNSQQVRASVIVVMRAQSRELEGQYNDVDIEGSGDLEVYQNGEEIKGIWKKDKANPASKLYFLDFNGQEIKFVPGQIWVEIIEPRKDVSYN